jgi:pyruvate/2-oxoglutarate dehydrogenase complex dihydrolipoamide acyltransferase (E2) component
VESEFLLLPKFAESLTEAKVVSWLIAEGGQARPGQPMVLVETDKMTIDVEVLFACTLEKILVPAGEVVAVGAPLARLGRAGLAPVAPTRREAGPTVLSAPVELSAMMQHRSRWQGDRPDPLSYLLLALGQAVVERPGLAGSAAVPERLSVGVLRSPEALEGVVSFEPGRTPVLVLDRLLRATRAQPPPGASLPRPTLCVGAGAFPPEQLARGTSAVSILLGVDEAKAVGQLNIVFSASTPTSEGMLQLLERHLREPILFPRKDG